MKINAWRIIQLITGLLILTSLILSASPARVSGDVLGQPVLIWREVSPPALPKNDSARGFIPLNYRVLAADMPTLDALLAQAPAAQTGLSYQTKLMLALPLPNDKLGRFYIEEAPLLAPALAAKFPAIKNYRGFGIDDPTAYVRLSRSPSGFRAMILSGAETIFIDPYYRHRDDTYLTYYKRDAGHHVTATAGETVLAGPAKNLSLQTDQASGPIRHTYRLAIAASGDYSVYHNGGSNDKGPVIDAINTTVSRVTGIYERELSVSFELVAGNDRIIFTDPQTDPYNGSILDLTINQTTIDALIGNDNYDVGHLFTKDSGGVAGLGVVCETGFKAGGLTGSNQPEGDPFDVDFVAHELGHQFGANHTFNANNAGSCVSFNFSRQTAFEPGSGSTLMAYAGICGPQNLQLHSDDYFHTASFDEITSFVSDPTRGGACGAHTPTGNSAPVVEAGPDLTITASTPFSLTGSATDAEGQALTYSWEQYDAGVGWGQTNLLPNIDPGFGPIFRSYPPLITATRLFPNPNASALAEKGEFLPITNRTLTFRLTARDGQGGVSYDTVQVVVAGARQIHLPILVKN